MNLLGKSLSKSLPGVAIGVGVALAAPVLLVAVASLLRPVAKTAIKGGFLVRDMAVGLYGAAGAQAGKILPQAEEPPTPIPEPSTIEVKAEPTPAPPKAERKPSKSPAKGTVPKKK